MRKIVLDTNCLLMSLPKISPYRIIWDEFLEGKLVLCVTSDNDRSVMRYCIFIQSQRACLGHKRGIRI